MATLLLSLALSATPALSWGHHYLVTDQALNHPEAATQGEEAVVEPIEDLLEAEPEAIAAAFAAHYDALEAKGSARFQRMSFDPASPTRAAFLKAARLNPEARLPLVVRDLPGTEPAYGFAVRPEAASPYLHEVDPLQARIEVTPVGTRIPAKAVVSTFSDEPDWGLDHELWPFAEYGYGEQPYGKAEGESSKAPFHMQFAHESGLVQRFVPELMEGMVPDRVDLFMRLSQAAFSTGHDYWGWRFAAWAVHYAQDLCQPYHSKAVPSATTAFYIRYVLSPRKSLITERTTQLAANRHFLYEDFVAYGLQASYLGDDPRYETLAGYLTWGDATFAVESPAALLDQLMAGAAEHALTIDRTLVRAFGPDLTKDWAYDVETAPDYSIVAEMSGMDQDAAQELLEETGKDFEMAGRAARTLLSMARGGGQ